MSEQTINRFIRDMRNEGKSPKTVSSYLYGIKRLVKYTKKQPEKVTLEEIKDFQQHMNTVEKTSWSTYNITTCAMRFFYKYTCPKKWKVDKVVFGRREKNLPVVLNEDEVVRMFKSARFFKFKVMMITAYSTGMRLNEIRNLKISDIDRGRSVVLVRCGKGAKQRQVHLSPILLNYLERLYHDDKGKMVEYVFFKKNSPTQPIDESWVQKNVKQARISAGINKKVTMHVFRHSFATHLIESGVNFIQLKKLMGHSNIKTTLKYVHVINESFSTIKSPIDSLAERLKDEE